MDSMISGLQEKMQKAVTSLVEDLGTIRTGRATPALVENIIIEAYEGTAHLRLKELATISTDGPRTLVIAPFDPSAIRDIEKGINSANLGFSGAPDGNIVRISIPPLTSERRDEYIKLAHAKVEGGRVMVRQIRHEAMSEVKRKVEAKEISEDEKTRLEKEIQNVTDKTISQIDDIKAKKEAELKEV